MVQFVDSHQRPLNILVPVRYPLGGIRTYLKYTYGKFDRHSYRFFLASQDVKWLQIVKDDLPGHQVTIVASQCQNESLAMVVAVWKSLKNHEIDLIHSQGYTAGIITCLLNLFFGKPHVVTLHHVFRANQFSDSFWDTLPRIKRFLIETILKTTSCIQPVSYDAKENLLENFPGLAKMGKRIVAIPNGIDVDWFLGNSGDIDLPAIPDGTFALGFMGRFMPEKGFQYLIDVVDSLVHEHQITDCKVFAIGGFGGFVREYRKEIERRNLAGYFHFSGFTKNVYGAFKQLAVVLIPSLGEACPLVPMEALVAGTPVIAFSCVGLREVLQGTPGIMVGVKDVTAMVNEIMRIKNEYDKIKSEFAAYVPEAMRRFDSKNTAKNLEQLFNEIIPKQGTV